MRLILVIVLMLLILGILGAPWRYGVYPLYKGMSSAVMWIINIICIVLMLAIAWWLANLVVGWFGM